jgi:hypothetical protein
MTTDVLHEFSRQGTKVHRIALIAVKTGRIGRDQSALQ